MRDDIELDPKRSTLAVVIPMSDVEVHGHTPAWAGTDIAHEVELPSHFLEAVRVFELPVNDGASVNLGPLSSAPNAKSQDALIQVRRVEAWGIGVSDKAAATRRTGNDADRLELGRWLLVVHVEPEHATSARWWVETARLLTKDPPVEKLLAAIGSHCDADAGPARLGVNRLAERSIVMPLLYVAATKNERLDAVATHLATRAPASEAVAQAKGEQRGITRLSDVQRQISTFRTCGFVLGEQNSTYLNEKLPRDFASESVLAVGLAYWTRHHFTQLLEQVDELWDESSDKQGGFGRSAAIRRRFGRISDLRRVHARVLASGALGPVFESATQRQFYDAVTDAFAIEQRRAEVEGALRALEQETDTEASLIVNRVIAFFTLVVGVPTFVFTVLGVNIDHYTADRGLSSATVLILLAVCLLVGSSTFLWVHGRRSSI